MSGLHHLVALWTADHLVVVSVLVVAVLGVKCPMAAAVVAAADTSVASAVVAAVASAGLVRSEAAVRVLSRVVVLLSVAVVAVPLGTSDAAAVATADLG